VIWLGRVSRSIWRLGQQAWQGGCGWFVPPYRTLVVEEFLPKQLGRRTFYVVQEDGYREQAAMICPCGCGRVLHMNLLPDERPCWRLTQHAYGTASLHPSVWRQKDCGSHFWFRRGRVEWCRWDS
jgi:Family of unknown function (DUF6527)